MPRPNRSTERALAIRERAVGPDHPDTATSTNNLASFYQAAGRPADALPLVQRLIASGRAQLRAALPVLLDAQREQLMPAEKALDDALNVIQRGTQSSAASAVNKLAVRLAAGSDRLAELVRRDQDLAAEAEALDKSIVAAVSKERAKRDVAAEAAQQGPARRHCHRTRAPAENLRRRISRLCRAVESAADDARRRFRRCLSGDEAMVLFAVTEKESYVFALTREGFDWKPMPAWRGSAVAKGRRVSPRPRYRQGQRCLRQVRPVRSGARQRTVWNVAGPGRAAGEGQAQSAGRAVRAR